MSKEKRYGFDEKYENGSKTKTPEKEEESFEFTIEEERYGIAKPQRKIVRAKLIRN